MPTLLLFWGSLATLVFILISFLLLAWKYGIDADWSVLFRLDPLYLLLAGLLLFLYHTFDVLRLKTIAAGYRIRYPWGYAYATSLVSTFGATVTPAHVGGVLIIFYMLKRLRVKPTKIWGTILFKTVSGVSFFILAFPLTLYSVYAQPELVQKLFTLLLIFLLFSAASYPVVKLFKRFEKDKKPKLLKTLKLYCLALIYFWKHNKVLFLKACLYSVLLYLTFLSFAPALLKAFGTEVSLIKVYLIQLPLLYAIFGSPSPGGSGVGELGAAALFQGLLPPETLGVFVILWRLISQYLSAAAGGILFIRYLAKDLRE